LDEIAFNIGDRVRHLTDKNDDLPGVVVRLLDKGKPVVLWPRAGLSDVEMGPYEKWLLRKTDKT
jgi:hypothetical protein